jgi:hypothetical protein
MKEERVLYPGIDRVTSQTERDTVFQNMKNISLPSPHSVG